MRLVRTGAVLICFTIASSLFAQSYSALRFSLPSDSAVVYFDSERGTATGRERVYRVGPLVSGTVYFYNVRVEAVVGGQVYATNFTLTFTGGAETHIIIRLGPGADGRLTLLPSVAGTSGGTPPPRKIVRRPVPPPFDGEGALLSAGWGSTCVLDYDRVRCWGKNERGEGNVPPLMNPKQISVGRDHACALDERGITCWGENRSGQCNVPPLLNPRFVSAGDARTCALDDNGLQCWGYLPDAKAPRLRNPRLVTSGFSHICALDDDGVKCWGDDPTFHETTVPTLRNPKEVAAGGYGTCALDDDGVKCWGRMEGEAMPSLKHPRHVTVGNAFACALDDEGVKCWGWWTMPRSPSLSHPRFVVAGLSHACALEDNGVKCWGEGAEKSLLTPPEGLLSNFKASWIGRELSYLEARHRSPLTKFLKKIGTVLPDNCTDDDPAYRILVPALRPIMESMGQEPRFVFELSRYNAFSDRTGLASQKWTVPGREAARAVYSYLGHTFDFLTELAPSDCRGLGNPWQALEAELAKGTGPLGPQELREGIRAIHERAEILQALAAKPDTRPYLLFVGGMVERLTGLLRSSLAERLDSWGERLYLPKGRILHLGAELLREEADKAGVPWLDRETTLTTLFIWNAVKPLLEMSQLEHFESKVLPDYLSTLSHGNAIYEIAGLKSFAPSGERKIAALRLLTAALEALRKQASSAADGRRLDELVALSGKAMASPQTATVPLLKELERSGPLLESFSGQGRSSALGVMVTTLREFLNAH